MFLLRLRGDITKRGTIDELRNEFRLGAYDASLFDGTHSLCNQQAKLCFARNRFTDSRQLLYSRDETRRAPDSRLFINGLPAITVESKINPTSWLRATQSSNAGRFATRNKIRSNLDNALRTLNWTRPTHTSVDT
ncbi:MAG: type I restriction endonuclease [Albidovulum sp.]|nr:type I restriction endonuclease [Albidovulum sp.]